MAFLGRVEGQNITNEEGLREGRDAMRARLVVWVLSADCDLGREIWYGRRCLEKSSWVKVCLGGSGLCGGDTVHLLGRL